MMLVALPCPALEFGSTRVSSRAGEPLFAEVRIHVDSGEEINNRCLSVGDEIDFPDSEHFLIKDAQLSLSPTRDSIRITTSRALNETDASMVLRVRCGDDPPMVDAINLYPEPPVQAPGARADSALAGSKLTVRAGDTIYGLARTIFRSDESAVRNLVHAIVLANPLLFPDGPRPLQIGEQLIIPDLRLVARIAADSGTSGGTVIPPARAQPKPAARSTGPENTGVSNASGRVVVQSRKPAGNSRFTDAAIPHLPGTLRLKLARSINLDRSSGMTEAGRTLLRQRLGLSASTELESAPIAANLQWTSRIARIRDAQKDIDRQLARLESKVLLLQHAANAQQISRLTDLPTASQTAGLFTTDSATAEDRFNWPLREREWQWAVAGVITLFLIVVAFVLGKRARQRTKTRRGGATTAVVPDILAHRQRIDSLLEEAREAAAPLLGTDPALPTDDSFYVRRIGEMPIHERTFSGERSFRGASSPDEPLEPELEPRPTSAPETEARWGMDTVELPPLDFPQANSHISSDPKPKDGALATVDNSEAEDSQVPLNVLSFPADSSGVIRVPPALLQEMKGAIDSSRSMFSDIDRFITLGRTQNAINLLQFQINRDPTDRQAWIKLLAIQHQYGMDAEFGRTLVEYAKQFGT